MLLALSMAQAQKPYERLPLPESVPDLASRIGEAGRAVWLEGDVLHVGVRSKSPLQLGGTLDGPLSRFGETDYWLGRFRMSGWDSAFLTVILFSDPSAGVQTFAWRGEKAPPAPKRAPTAAVSTWKMASKSLGEERTVSVYVPEGAKGPLPVVVFADGQGAKVFAEIAQALLDEGKIRPVAVLGIHNGGYRGEPGKAYDPSLDFRAKEYLEPHDRDRFTRHLAWVVEEVLPQAAERYGISTRREDRVVAGFSNGGAFAAQAAIRAHGTFGAAIPMSVGVPLTGPKPEGPLPRFLFAAGTLEPGFLDGTRKCAETAKVWGAQTEVWELPSGHDPALWELGFARALPILFPPL